MRQTRHAKRSVRTPSLEQEIAQQIGPALAALSEQDRLAHRANARWLDLAAAIARALLLCERHPSG